MTVLRAFLRPERRSIQSSPWGAWPGESSGSWAGVKVDNESALQLLTVYGCNRFICEGISTLPIDTFRDTSKGTVEAAKPPWLEQPTADLDVIAWLTQVLTSLLLDGNAYLRKVYDGAGQLMELVPLNPAVCKPYRDRGRKAYRINGLDADGYDILHIPAVMFPGSDVGMSPVEAARQTIGKGLSTEEFAARFFGEGLNMAGVIETPQDVTDDQARMMANTFARRHSGKKKAHLPAVLPNGAHWQATGVTNEQAQFLETQEFTAAQIASFMFLIDPTELGLGLPQGTSLTYQNLEQRNIRKVQVTFLPWTIRIERALSALIRQSNRYVRFNVDGLLRSDLKTRYESYAIGISSGFLLPNEARELENRPPLLGGDEFPSTPPAEPSMPTQSNGATHIYVHPMSPDVHVHSDGPTINNNIEPSPAPDVHVHVPEQAPPEVHLNVEAPPASDVHVDVHVPEQAPPIVRVDVPPTPAPPRAKRLEYNELGDISRIISED